MIHVTCRLTAKNRDQLRNPTLGNRVWAAFPFYLYTRSTPDSLRPVRGVHRTCRSTKNVKADFPNVQPTTRTDRRGISQKFELHGESKKQDT